MQPLFEKEKLIYEFIKSYLKKYERAPSYHEIQRQFGYRSASSVQQFVEQLIKKGYLKARAGSYQKRALEVTETPYADTLNRETKDIPLEGVVAAGTLHEAIQNREMISVPKQMLQASQEYFALKIKGDSMIDACILDGDVAIIRKEHSARNGQTVVALMGDEATIKTFYKTREAIELRPANNKYKPIVIKKGQNIKDFKVLGILAGLIRRCE